MNRLILRIIIAIFGATLLGLAISIDKGYVFIKYSRFEYQSTLWVTLAIIAILWFAYCALKILIELIFYILGKANPFSNRRKLYYGEIGFKELTEGNWSAALRHLAKASRIKRQSSLMYFLGAAKAANELGKYQRCDRFIETAYEKNPESKIAIGVTFIGLLIDRKDYDSAQAIAQELYKIAPYQPTLINYLYTIYLHKENWVELKKLLPSISKYKILPKESYPRFELLVWLSWFKGEFTGNSIEQPIPLAQIQNTWSQVPPHLHKNFHVVEVYIQQLYIAGENLTAEQFLRESINKNYQSELVYMYGQLKTEDFAKQLTMAERWVKKHNTDAVLYLTLGRLSIANQKFDQAKEYLERSIQINHSAEAYAELANLLAQQGHIEESNHLFKESIKLLHKTGTTSKQTTLQLAAPQ